jgi:alkaline phosphatase D
MATLTESPVVGAVTPTGAKVNCRTSAAADVSIEYADNKRFKKSTTTSSVATSSASDFTATIELAGLDANTMYWYRVKIDGVTQDTGHVQKFSTFPSGSQAFTFAVTADVAPTDRAAACYSNVNDDGALFLIQLGDFDHRDPTTLAEMRDMHRDMKDSGELHGADFAKYVSSKMGVVHVWDDHDYGGNDTDKTFAGRSDAFKAFDEHWPTYSRPSADCLYHSFICGDAEFFMLDTRSHRDPNTDPDDANKSMLGSDQKQWLKDGLLNSTAVWKFVMSTVTSCVDARPSSSDLWKSFSTERNEIKDFINNNNIENVIVICGDIHTGGGIDDGTNMGFGLPEMTVPHTNLVSGNTANLGTWSEGVTAGARGYGLVTVSSTSVTLYAKSANGSVRHSLTLAA